MAYIDYKLLTPIIQLFSVIYIVVQFYIAKKHNHGVTGKQLNKSLTPEKKYLVCRLVHVHVCDAHWV